MQDFKNLIAWQKSHDFVKEIYLHSSAFPSYELYGLTSQLRRAAMSIPANLAEGASRGSKADFARFVQISMGSAAETEYLLFLAFELGYFSSEIFEDMSEKVVEIKKVMAGFLKKLRN